MVRLAYRLSPASGVGFHFGREGLAQETTSEFFPSDSLFSALVTQLAHVAPDEVDILLTEFTSANRPVPFRVSSLFPIVGDVPMLPMPRLRIEFARRSDITSKSMKKLRYVSPTIFQALVNGQAMDAWFPKRPTEKGRGLLLFGGRVWIASDETEMLPPPIRARPYEHAIWDVETVPRVTVDRINNASVPYQVGRTTFAPDCGLWLLADVREEFKGLLENLLLHLADSGIGGERSAGYGGFSLHRLTTPQLPHSDNRGLSILLSRYNPTEEEIINGVLGDGAAYELVDVGGWLASPGVPAQRRQRIRMIESGSVLVGHNISGHLVDVRPRYDNMRSPQHPVYRSGLALTVGV